VVDLVMVDEQGDRDTTDQPVLHAEFAGDGGDVGGGEPRGVGRS